jgi:hypothetical protein
VSLAHLREFAAAVPRGLTTKEVVELHIKPVTDGLSYTQQHEGAPFVAPATHFVSHVWGYDFREMVEAVLSMSEDEGGGEGVFVWLDVLTVNQHKASDNAYDKDWWANTFKKAVAAFGHTVLVMMPWEDPAPLKRSWCLWEILATLEGGAALDVRLHAREKDRLAAALRQNDDSVALNMSKLDVAKAEAWSKEDQANILAAARASQGGILGVNASILAEMRNWLARTGRELGGGTDADLNDAFRVAHLLKDQGNQAEAERMFRRVVDGKAATMGATHPETPSPPAALRPC